MTSFGAMRECNDDGWRNKAQGQSLTVAGVVLTEPCFSHGQLYVALSRVGTSAGLFVLAKDGQTKNVVYQNALL